MWIVPVLFFALPGLALAISAYPSRRMPPTPPPPAKIEDKHPFPRPGRIRYGRLVGGSLLIVVGALLAGILYVASQWGDGLKLGRPVRVRGRVRLPARRRGETGHDGAQPRLSGLSRWRRAWHGARWHEAARAEYASISAFDELVAELQAVNADTGLIARCRAAARDEENHANRCYTLASAYSGLAWCAGAMPARPSPQKDLVSLAVESFVDGCIGEAISAAIARRGAELATDPVVAQTLATIAEDEARHSELGWAIVDHCVARGGEPVVRRVLDATRVVPRTTSRGPTDVPPRECTAITARVQAAARAELARRRPSLIGRTS